MLSRDFLFKLQNFLLKNTSHQLRSIVNSFIMIPKKQVGNLYLEKPEMLNMLIKIIQLLKVRNARPISRVRHSLTPRCIRPETSLPGTLIGQYYSVFWVATRSTVCTNNSAQLLSVLL